MKRKIQREVLIETEKIALFVSKNKSGHLQCSKCGGESVMFSPLFIAEILKVSSREIYQLIEADKIHYVENDLKQMYVCVASLAKVFSKKKKLLH